MGYASKDIRNILVAGHAGCGKTTLLRALCRLIKADSGSITLCGGTAETDIAALAPKALARRVSFLPQQRAVPDITAKTLVSHGRYPYLGFSRTLSNNCLLYTSPSPRDCS